MTAISALRLIVPSVWIGLILGLSFIEAPLKFMAPGITIPLGLGIGRLMFWALAIGGFVLLLVLTTSAVLRPRVPVGGWALIGCLWVLMLVQSFAIRPALSARSDIVIAGGDPGPSVLHYVYIATDMAILITLVLWIVITVRSSRTAPVQHR